MLVVDGDLGQELVGDLRVELGAPRPGDGRRAAVRSHVGRPPTPKLAGSLDHARVGVRDRDRPQLTVLLDVDPAPIREPRHGQFCHPVERLAHVE